MMQLMRPAKRLAAFALAGMLVAGCELQDPAQPGNLVPKTVDDDPSLPALTLSSTKLYYQTFGDPSKKPVIVLHGGPGADFRLMLSLMRRVNGYSLADDYFFVFYDQRGAGQSRRHGKEELNTGLMLKDLEEIVDRYSPNGPVALLGHSWGGTHAMQYLNTHPSRVKAAILMEPDGAKGTFNKEVGGTDVGGPNFTDIQNIAWTRGVLTGKNHELADYQVRVVFIREQQRFETPFARSGFLSIYYVNLNELSNNTYDFSQRLHEFTGKALFLQGDKSVISRDFQQKYNFQFFPNRAVYTFPDCDHSEMFTNPQNVPVLINQVKTFLHENY
ncbi:alpha/beta hydrolase [Hymenobacter sp. BT664]|uniref:Proline iminopeptidase n=1 Tax=Hymenobacter montanus TaxID=2771359 RepID=A0A927BAI3_9BACT|nr:alpha/beta hydrolase [Hymenobacter montanus]MBD2766609.1 alpha/beta hydrolase [Hymenobacter montanus]